MKLGCDGTRPCNTCTYKAINCTYLKVQSKQDGPKKEYSPPTPKSWQDSTTTSPSHRGSINFLLNSGTASFIDCFRFPPPTEGRGIFNLRNGSSNIPPPNTFSNENANINAYPMALGTDKQDNWPVLPEDDLARFMSNVAADMPIQPDAFASIFMNGDSTHAEPIIGALCPAEWEPASAQSAAILQALLGKSAMLKLNDQEQADIAQHLNHLFVPSKIEKFINCYFELWHRHCPMVHRPSFSIERTPVPLLISMTLIGAMYSQAELEVSSVRVVLDLAELYIYGLDDLSDEFEIQQVLRFSTTSPQSQRPVPGYETLKNAQAAYLIIVIQVWAGNLPARKRIRESRFSTLIKTARRFGFTKARHDLHTSHEEDLWIERESQIRLINAMTLLDSAFLFFSNFPPRLSVNEMKFDLNSEEALFASAHPFSEPTFLPSRQLTVYEVFRSLFSQEKLQPPDRADMNPLGLNVVDMFTLIHLLYIYTHTQISCFSSFATCTPEFSMSSTSNTPEQHASPNSNMALIRTALSRWHALWLSIRASTPHSVWANLGLFRNGYNYWLVTQLLVNNEGSVEVMQGMEVNCEDTLQQLQSLLKDGGTDI